MRTKKTPMIALKSVKTLPATMLETEREEVSEGEPSLRRRLPASALVRRRSAASGSSAGGAGGFASVGAARSSGSDVVSVLAWLAPQTKAINLGPAILQVPARPPAAAGAAGGHSTHHTRGRL